MWSILAVSPIELDFSPPDGGLLLDGWQPSYGIALPRGRLRIRRFGWVGGWWTWRCGWRRAWRLRCVRWRVRRRRIRRRRIRRRHRGIGGRWWLCRCWWWGGRRRRRRRLRSAGRRHRCWRNKQWPQRCARRPSVGTPGQDWLQRCRKHQSSDILAKLVSGMNDSKRT